MDSGKLEIAVRGSKLPLRLILVLCGKEQRVDGYSSCFRQHFRKNKNVSFE